MTATMDFSDAREEIRERLDLVEIIGQYVALRRSGQRFVGLCPFHQESTPSFNVDPQRGLWHCFGCGEGGDLFAFVMRQEGVDFAEALRILARRAGVQLEHGPQADQRRHHRDLLERAHEIAHEHFRRNLFEHPQAAPARRYLRTRGLNRWAIETFGLGYALDSWDDLLNTLAAEGVNPDIAQEAGLVKPGERGGRYDTFRDRIMFPISDPTGRIIAFGGRALDPENPAKYLNSPETPLFRKRRSVYALPLAREEITRQRRAIIVEGYMDVIALHQAGVRNVVAGLGTALSRDQLDLLGRYAEEVVLIYDADAAGARAALRNLEVIEGAGVAVSLVVLPEGLDPDDFVRSRGADAFTELLAERISPIEYELRMIFAAQEDAGPEGMAGAAREAVEVLLKVRDWTRRDEFVARAADLWGRGHPGRTESMARVLKLELSTRASGRRHDRPVSPRDPSFITQTLTRSPSGLLRAETELLAQALDDEELARWVVAELPPEALVHEADRAIFMALKGQFVAEGKLDVGALVEGLPEEGGVRRRGVELTVTEVRRVELESEDDRWRQAEETIRRLRTYRATGRVVGVCSSGGDLPDDDELSSEQFAELEARVNAGINSGELTSDDPLVQRYRAVRARLQGRGRRGFYGDPPPQSPASSAVGPQKVSSRPQTAVHTDELPSQDEGPPADDPWAVEEGDPFAGEA